MRVDVDDVTERPGATVIRESDGAQGRQSGVVEMERTEIDPLPYASGMGLTLSGVGTCVGVPLLLGAGLIPARPAHKVALRAAPRPQ